jgi:hypothetical protein
VKKAPSQTNATGAYGEQLSLLPLPAFSPIWPSSTTIAGRVLAVVLPGVWLDHHDVIAGYRAWRLVAYVQSLKYMDWPIESFDQARPWANCKGRKIAVYGWSPSVISQVQSLRGVA